MSKISPNYNAPFPRSWKVIYQSKVHLCFHILPSWCIVILTSKCNYKSSKINFMKSKSCIGKSCLFVNYSLLPKSKILKSSEGSTLYGHSTPKDWSSLHCYAASFKGPFCDPSMIFLWHTSYSVDVDKLNLFPNFQSILRLHLLCMLYSIVLLLVITMSTYFIGNAYIVVLEMGVVALRSFVLTPFTTLFRNHKNYWDSIVHVGSSSSLLWPICCQKLYNLITGYHILTSCNSFLFYNALKFCTKREHLQKILEKFAERCILNFNRSSCTQ